MFSDIARFLIDIFFTLFGAVLLLRAWMQNVRLAPGNPVARGVFQATDWIVKPLRRVIPGAGGIDWASIVAAWLVALVFLVLTLAVIGGNPLMLFPMGFAIALLTVLKWALNLLLWMTLIMAVLSWVNPSAPAMPLLYQLTAPFLNPLRRVTPRLGGFDMAPLLLFVIVQVLLMVVARLSATWFGW
ncbi:YggT family protein [Pigmentiphaga aceris]|uniref:YggT family protein n=1 Tax=Pigmentiphaga aceris TaxID=1940612 RepID=A0A5C0ASB0_9BURK|nr:YggT family protein [Pigmentiphaga aceris]QEI05068.1 YggT family protein [Pigmentiphaga aceris]